MKKLINYVCYERTYNYIMQYKYNLQFEFLYFSRIYGFSFYENQAEPIIRLNDSYKDFVLENISKKIITNDENLLLDLKKFLSDGYLVQLPFTMYTKNNEPYFTNVLFENYLNNKYYYTKISENEISINKEISEEDVIKRLASDYTHFEIFNKTININFEEKLSQLKNNELYYKNENGFYEFIQYQKLLIENNKLDLSKKENQLFFSKHILNKLYTITSFLESINYDKNKLELLLNKFYFISSYCISNPNSDNSKLKNYLEILNEIHEQLENIKSNFKGI